MQKSYTKNYVKIYFWQFLSILLNLLSLFIVIPQLSSQPGIYGIYSICVSAVIFLSYADLGFLNAGFKYASEAYAQGKKEEEQKVIGFVSFILALFVLVFAGCIITLSFHPGWLIKNLDGESNIRTARMLLLTLALFSPNVILQRALMVIFGVRLEDYIYQRFQILINISKIASVFYFFRSGHYDIVGYFLFCQAITTLGLIAAFFTSGKRYSITLLSFLRSLRFSRQLYNEVKNLALSTFALTISWILYYELDVYAIAKLSGAQAVAYYSIGLTCLSFFRTIFGTLFNPFTARFNHFIALNDEQGLKQLYQTVLSIMLPLVVFPILSVVFLSRPFVFNWVGANFAESVPVVILLTLCNVLGFISYPSSILLIARREIRSLYYLAAVQPLIFWIGILLTFPHMGYVSFAYFKLIAFLISSVFYLNVSFKVLNVGFLEFLNKVIKPAVLPVLLLSIALYFLAGYLPLEKNKFKLLLTIATGGITAGICLVVYYFTSSMFRLYVKNIYSRFSANISTK